jgi:hypothetical protein
MRRKLSYDKHQFSPFKRYLKISEDTVITRKISQTKSKVPPAISGKEYLATLIEKQEKKAQEIKKKKKTLKESIKRKIHVSTSDNINLI